MNSRLLDFILGGVAVTILLSVQVLVHDDDPQDTADTSQFSCIPFDQGQKAIITVRPDGNLFCEKHAELGYAETGIPHLTCPVPEEYGCGVE